MPSTVYDPPRRSADRKRVRIHYTVQLEEQETFHIDQLGEFLKSQYKLYEIFQESELYRDLPFDDDELYNYAIGDRIVSNLLLQNEPELPHSNISYDSVYPAELVYIEFGSLTFEIEGEEGLVLVGLGGIKKMKQKEQPIEDTQIIENEEGEEITIYYLGDVSFEKSMDNISNILDVIDKIEQSDSQLSRSRIQRRRLE